MGRLPGGLPRRHPVQGDGDGAHVVLGEDQPEQGGELVQLHGGLLQLCGALLQAAAQDGPQLPVLLRQGGLVLAAQRLHPLLQPLRQADPLQKAVKGDRLPTPGPVGVFPQQLQGLGHLPPHPVQLLHQGPVRPGPLQAVPPGVQGPGLLLGPPAPPQVPLEHIVLQQVQLLLGQVGEAGLQIAEHVLIPVAVGHRVQGRRHQGEDGLLQNIRHGGGEHRHLVAGEYRLDQGLVGGKIPGHHPDVPVAVPLLPHQLPDAGGRPLHLGAGGGGLEQLHRAPAGEALRLPVGKQGPLQPPQGWGLLLACSVKDLNFTGYPLLPGQAAQGGGGAPGGREDAGAPLVLLQVVAGEGDGEGLRLLHQLPEHRLLLGGEVGKAVQPHLRPPGPGALLQLLRRAGEPVPGVQGGAGGQGLVGGADEPQVPQLVPLVPAGPLRRLEQVLRPDTAALQLVQGGQQLLQKGGPPGGAGVHGEAAGHRLHRPAHQQDAAAGVQLRLPHPPGGQEHPAAEAAEGEHLGVQGHPVPAEAAQGPLRLVGLLLRHHEDLPPVLPWAADGPEHRRGLAAARPAQDQLYHPASLPSRHCSHHTTLAPVKKDLLLPRPAPGEIIPRFSLKKARQHGILSPAYCGKRSV